MGLLDIDDELLAVVKELGLLDEDAVLLCERVILVLLDALSEFVWVSLGVFVVLGVLDELAVILVVRETEWLADGLPEFVIEGLWDAEHDPLDDWDALDETAVEGAREAATAKTRVRRRISATIPRRV